MWIHRPESCSQHSPWWLQLNSDGSRINVSFSFPCRLTGKWMGKIPAAHWIRVIACPFCAFSIWFFLLSGFFLRKTHTTHGLPSVFYIPCSQQVLRLKYMLIVLWNLKFKPQKNNIGKVCFNQPVLTWTYKSYFIFPSFSVSPPLLQSWTAYMSKESSHIISLKPPKH